MWRLPKNCSLIIKLNFLGQTLLSVSWLPQVLAPTTKCFPADPLIIPKQSWEGELPAIPAAQSHFQKHRGLIVVATSHDQAKGSESQMASPGLLSYCWKWPEGRVIGQSKLYNWGVWSKMTEATSKYAAPGLGPLMNVSFVFNFKRRQNGRQKDPSMWHGVHSQWERLKSTAHYIPEESLSEHYSKYYNPNL